MANRLAGSTSPYLRQHADNPIDWQPWSAGAFAEARRREVPVLLSVGYAACHWCHVMAHESFSDPEVAAYVNEHFVAIKVDREERPDVDAVYMEATQAMTGQGGWPMTCFLTADGDPFHCGTYYPARPYGGMPSFTQLLGAVVRAWTTDGERVRDAARAITQRLSRRCRGRCPRPGSTPTPSPSAVVALTGDFDEEHGGFGGAPKFPPSAVLEFLLRHHERTGELRRARDDRHHRRGDGPRRAVRPARGRVRPLLGRRDVDRAALREDALRQRPAAAGLRPPRAADRAPGPPRASPT